jgi:outer membrane lipoprotein LolB
LSLISAEKLQIDVVRSLLICMLSTMLASCASVYEQIEHQPADWDARLEQHNQIDDWTIKARLGIQTELEGGSFDVFWQQSADFYDIRLVAPMGQGAVHIAGSNSGVTIRLADGQQEYARDAETLFASMTGLSLPVNGLRDWLRGMPIQGEKIHNTRWNENGQLYKFVQRGWRVEMNRYQKVADYELPHAFYLERDDRPDLSVRLLVREWQLTPASPELP